MTGQSVPVTDPSDLPADLRAFLAEGRSLQYDASAAEAGQVRLHSDPPVVILNVDSDGAGWAPSDPHAGETGYYAVPAIDLIAACDESYDPAGLLVWLPKEQTFGTWDMDHWDITVFLDVTWADIEADPLTYLNAQWEGGGTTLVPVERYDFVEGRPF